MSPLELFLFVNGVAYILLGCACLLKPAACANLIGLVPQGHKGFAEFSAVYGGLELGLGVFYLLATSTLSLQSAALVFSICLYGGIVWGRCFSLYRNGRDLGMVWLLFSLEVAVLLWALLLLF